MEANKIQVVDDEGNELEFEVLFTFDNEENGKKYVLYYDPSLEESNVYASVYNDNGDLFEIDNPEEWEMVEDLFHTYMENQADHHDHECGCGKHHDHDHECGCEDDECGCEGHDHDDHECGCGHKHN